MTILSQLSQHAAVVSQIDMLEIWLRARMAYAQEPGVAVAIVHDQELVYAQGFGVGVSAENSIFRIASHSKLFTAISIMQLRDAGKLHLDDPITTHLPWYNIQVTDTDAPPITIRHLLTHTSGSPREAGSGYWIDFDFPSATQVRERLSSQTTAFPTENRFKYSNLAYGIAGYIVEALSGQSFNDYVQQHILQPLSMTSTSVTFPDAHKDRLINGYGKRMPDNSRAVMPFIDARGLDAATGMSSTVIDMATFMQWQLRCRDGDDDSVLKPSSLREMQRPHWIEPNWRSGRGLGFGIVHSAERDQIGHGGGYPGYLTYTCISPSEKLGVSVFTNSLDGQPNMIATQILKWFAPAIAKANAQAAMPAPDPAWSKLVGTYRMVWGDYHVSLRDGKLVTYMPAIPDPTGFMFTLEPKEDGSFTLEGENGGRAIGEAVVFECDETGLAQRMRVGHNWMERVAYDVPQRD